MKNTIGDLAKLIKNMIPEEIPKDYALKPMFKGVADEESVRRGVLAFRKFLRLLYDRLIADAHVYDKPVKKDDSHAGMAEDYPFLNIVKSVLFNIGYHGELSKDGGSLLFSDMQSLGFTICALGSRQKSKITAPKIAEALRFLTHCGVCVEGVDLDAPKPGVFKAAALTVSYPDDRDMPVGLKVMALAQRELDNRGNDDVFLRCDYRVLKNEETGAESLLKDFIYPLPANIQEFALKLHRRYMDKGLVCKPQVGNFFAFQFAYLHKNKEVWSFFASPAAGYRLLVKAQNTDKYPAAIEKFAPALREKIGKGYGCEKKRLGEPCQKGCHGFSFPLDDATLALGGDIEKWIDEEFFCKFT